MVKSMRAGTLGELGLGTVLEMFVRERMPVEAGEMVERVFGPARERGALVISGGNGIVGSGKAMQLGARLEPYGVPIATLDLPDAPDGIGAQWPGLKAAFGAGAGRIMANVVRFSYDGGTMPPGLARFRPAMFLEAIPEVLELKRAHYRLIRETFPKAQIRSVTSGFPARELGVGILHPSFPHPVNKVWEVVEPAPSDITKLWWALGMIPAMVGDYWSFVLDVLFCGLTLAELRYHRAGNTPFWKLDRLVRRLLGPNPVRAHDAIGPGAAYLTWSCLHHLAERYGELFRPTEELERRRISGERWYSANRPVVDWDEGDQGELRAWVLGAVMQMTSLMLHERRGSLPVMNAIGELCAQFRRGVLAVAREMGKAEVVRLVKEYHRRHPEAARTAWFPRAFDGMERTEWQMLYVNAEHDGRVGVVTISREALNWDVVRELNRAVDWLKKEGIRRVILTHDFHLATQLVGADTAEFFPALHNEAEGFKVAAQWSQTARRFHDEFEVSVGFVGGKRCLGGMLELMAHCHYLVAVGDAQLGMPEVTLPVVPGMEGCHWLLRKVGKDEAPLVVELLLTGRPVAARDAVGWLVDWAGPAGEALKAAWAAAQGKAPVKRRTVEKGRVKVAAEPPALPAAGAGVEAGRRAIWQCVKASCGTTLGQALEVQARHSAAFMATEWCRKGAVGTAAKRVMEV